MEKLRFIRTIRGNLKQAKPPYVQFEGVKYTSDSLACSYELIGKIMAIYVHPLDGRVVTAIFLNGTEDGEELGTLTAKGR